MARRASASVLDTVEREAICDECGHLFPPRGGDEARYAKRHAERTGHAVGLATTTVRWYGLGPKAR